MSADDSMPSAAQVEAAEGGRLTPASATGAVPVLRAALSRDSRGIGPVEWNPALLELRGELEARFLGALRADVEPHADVGSALDSLLVEPVHGTGAGPAAVRFYTEHVEADAVHEQLVRREVIGGLLADEPELESDVPERWSPEPP